AWQGRSRRGPRTVPAAAAGCPPRRSRPRASRPALILRRGCLRIPASGCRSAWFRTSGQPPEQFSGGDPSCTGGTHGRTGGTVADEEDPGVAPDGHLGVHGDAAVAGAQVQRREVFERGPEPGVPEDHVDILDPFGGERGP